MAIGAQWARIKRIARKPPRYGLSRLGSMLAQEWEVAAAPLRVRRLESAGIARTLKHESISGLWSHLQRGDHPFCLDAAELRNAMRGPDREWAELQRRAELAKAHCVDLLGSGSLHLGTDIDWSRDYKTGGSWPAKFFRRIKYGQRGAGSDVKFPWELARMQWMIPMGQAYVLGGDEGLATEARELLADWIEKNPYAHSVNWVISMEVAIRASTWIWLFHAFSNSAAWSSESFREKFLSALYLHGDYVFRNLEKSDINGNHYTANAMGLVLCGIFFGRSRDAGKWLLLGREILEREIRKQIFEDGVDFEASTAYHRLVTEMFLIAALYLDAAGLKVSTAYNERLAAMARFVAAYSCLDGTTPLWGDADDGRALPFGTQELNDHRYLVALVANYLGDPSLADSVSEVSNEAVWFFGAATMRGSNPTPCPRSIGFPAGGFFVMRNEEDHVFIDCGPLGLAGRGGHGHNDLLSFAASLCGQRLVADCGSFVYTADYDERNRFRSTAYHNTPRVDGLEINRFVSPDNLWALCDDASFEVLEWAPGQSEDVFQGAHLGYARLPDPVIVRRRIVLKHSAHALMIDDRFDGKMAHDVEVPLHLFPDVEVIDVQARSVELSAKGLKFRVEWRADLPWQFSIEQGRVSESYGRARGGKVLLWKKSGELGSLHITISPG